MPRAAPPTQELTPLGPTLVFQSGGGKLCLQPFALRLEALQLGGVAVLFSGGLDLSDFQLHLLELTINKGKSLQGARHPISHPSSIIKLYNKYSINPDIPSNGTYLVKLKKGPF